MQISIHFETFASFNVILLHFEINIYIYIHLNNTCSTNIVVYASYIFNSLCRHFKFGATTTLLSTTSIPIPSIAMSLKRTISILAIHQKL